VGQAEGAAGKASGYLLTHLVVEPTGRIALGRLVPLPLAHAVQDGVQLSCTRASFEQLPMAEASRLVPGAERSHGIVGSWYSGIGIAANDIVPVGEVVLHAGAPVESAGPRSLLAGVSVDRESSGRIVDFLVSTRRRWGRRRLTAVNLTSALAENRPGAEATGLPV